MPETHAIAKLARPSRARKKSSKARSMVLSYDERAHDTEYFLPSVGTWKYICNKRDLD
jgi:hypothetical protein